MFCQNLTWTSIFLSLLLGVSTQDAANCPVIVERSKWEAFNSTNETYLKRPVKFVIIHHTATSTCNGTSECGQVVKLIQHKHQVDYGWSDIGYNFLIGNGGAVYEGIGWHRVGAHTRGYNSKSIGIAFIGEFSQELPSSKALRAINKLLQCGVELGELYPEYMLYGARQISATASPGTALFNDIQEWDHFDPSPVV